MKDYASMSDQQINQLVGTIVSRDGLSIIASNGNAVIHEYSDCGDFKGICLGWKVFDPCNNPADAWPIVNASRISIMFDGTDPQCEGEHHEWCDAISSSQKFGIQHQSNPLRAAMIVFLMMKESEND